MIRRWGILDSGGAKRTDRQQIQVVGTYADNSTTVQVSTLSLVKSPLLGMGNLHAQQFVCRRPEGCIHGHRGNPGFAGQHCGRSRSGTGDLRVAAGGPGAHGYRGASPQEQPTADSTAVRSKNPAAAGFCCAPRAPGSNLHELATACDGTHQARPAIRSAGFQARAPGADGGICGSSRHPALSADAVEGAVEANGAVAFGRPACLPTTLRRSVQPPRWPLPG